MFNLQEHLLAQGNLAGTINRYLGSVKAVFDYLFMKGDIPYNVFDQVKMLKTGGKRAKTVRGCHKIDQVKGVFNTEWEVPDGLQYLLCLMIYSTGMRNSELERIRVKDIEVIEGCYFINVAKSKSRNGIRKVPLHPFVYEKVLRYAKQRHSESYLFSAKGNHNQSTLYKGANAALGERLGMSEEELKKQGITFYSGRHYWKTLMNSEGLGDDIEEYFMGHKVSGDVKKRYNHKDKQGKTKLVAKAKEIGAILDRKLFTGKV
jgi:integrase